LKTDGFHQTKNKFFPLDTSYPWVEVVHFMKQSRRIYDAVFKRKAVELRFINYGTPKVAFRIKTITFNVIK